MDNLIKYYINWLSKELDEDISPKRAFYITLWAISFLVTCIGGCAESIVIAFIGIVGMLIFAIKGEMIEWQKNNQ